MARRNTLEIAQILRDVPQKRVLIAYNAIFGYGYNNANHNLALI
jgi:hypothetical protein